MKTRALLAAAIVAALAGPVTASNADEDARAETRLSASEIVGSEALQDGYLYHAWVDGVSARLTDADGNPLAGRSIRFVSRGIGFCAAVTNEHGRADCNSRPTAGYTAIFDGDETHAPSSSEGYVLIFDSDGTHVRVLGDETAFDAWSD